MSTPAPFNRIGSGRRLAGRMTGTVKAVAFWAAVTIPLTYPFLMYAGLDGINGYLFVALLFANAVALAVGHDYNAQ